MMLFSQDYQASKSWLRYPRIMGWLIEERYWGCTGQEYPIPNAIEWAEDIGFPMIMNGPMIYDFQD